MQFLCFVHVDRELERGMTPAEKAAFDRENKEYGEWLQRDGRAVMFSALQEPETATLIRSRDNRVSMTDGPYAESKEQMGGFWVIDVPDLDTALEYARRGSAACEGPVEVRPFQGVVTPE